MIERPPAVHEGMRPPASVTRRSKLRGARPAYHTLVYPLGAPLGVEEKSILSRATPRGRSDPRKGPVPGGAPSSPPARRPIIPIWVWWILLVATLVWNGYEFFFHKEPPAVSLSYSDFLGQVRTAQIASITISGQNVDGVFKQPV